MKLLNRLTATPAHSTIDTRPNVQASPYVSERSSGQSAIFVDAACSIGTGLLVAGWCTDRSADIGLSPTTTESEVQTFRVARPDVVKHYKLPKSSGKALGFVLYLRNCPEDSVAVTWRHSAQEVILFAPLQIGALDNVLDWHPFGGIASLFTKFSFLTPEWRLLLSMVPIDSKGAGRAYAFLEGAMCIGLSGDAIVFGWLLHEQGALVWIEDDYGQIYSLSKAFRRYRQDVIDSIKGALSSHHDSRAGFVLHVPSAGKANQFKIKTLTEDGVHLLSEVGVTRLPGDPVKVAQHLFGIHTPAPELHERIPLVDEPILSPLIKHRVATIENYPVQVRQLGRPTADVRASVIVPLYGRSDFVEHQLIEFCVDPWFAKHADLIYVLDDPKLVDSFGVQAEALHRLYRLPFRWVWGGVNRGFAGANNLGASQARTEYFLFLNSDAFPQQVGWLEALVDVLQQNPDIGAVGPRLVFADGSIQHAGMEFLRLDELGLWVNHHPWMGIDPSLDPHHGITIVPSITGACLAMRRGDFERIGGWDTGYLIGDFEDSDLCLKLREVGSKIAYCPSVQLVHLERQTFKLLGTSEFRMGVTVYNALRHQSRWAALLASPPSMNY